MPAGFGQVLSGGTTSRWNFARSLFLALLLLLPSCRLAAQSIPSFRFFKMKTGEGLVSLVVPPATTADQLKALVRYIQSKIQQGKYSDLGIRQPTSKLHGKLGYDAGIISVYRGEKCANEQFINALGPCGYGEHDAASYQWGVEGNPKQDEGVIRLGDGTLQKLF
jgi:hypothetical protein